jgi:hypothetical protein
LKCVRLRRCMSVFQKHRLLGVVLLFVGLLFVFAPFQNCSLHESPDRKTMNEEGLGAIQSDCAPYLNQEQAAQILSNPQARVAFLKDANPLTCAVTISGTTQTGLNSYRCTFAESNVDRAQNPPTGGSEVPIGSSSKTPPLYFHSYYRQDSSPTLTTYVITVGALAGHREGVSCGSTFSGNPGTTEMEQAAKIQLDLVREMVNGTP